MYIEVSICRILLLLLNPFQTSLVSPIPFLPQALHEVAGCIHFDLNPQQLLVDGTGSILLSDFNICQVMSVNPTDGKYCPVESARRTRHIPWASPENYAGKVTCRTPAAEEVAWREE